MSPSQQDREQGVPGRQLSKSTAASASAASTAETDLEKQSSQAGRPIRASVETRSREEGSQGGGVGLAAPKGLKWWQAGFCASSNISLHPSRFSV